MDHQQVDAFAKHAHLFPKDIAKNAGKVDTPLFTLVARNHGAFRPSCPIFFLPDEGFIILDAPENKSICHYHCHNFSFSHSLPFLSRFHDDDIRRRGFQFGQISRHPTQLFLGCTQLFFGCSFVRELVKSQVDPSGNRVVARKAPIWNLNTGNQCAVP